jgi:hypothetical protein
MKRARGGAKREGRNKRRNIKRRKKQEEEGTRG